MKQRLEETLRGTPVNEGGGIEIRRARPADAAALLPLIRAYYRFDGIRFRAGSIAQTLARLLKDRRLGCVWIFRDGTKAIGYVLLSFNFDLEFGGFEGLVTDLFVHDDYRGRGLGKRALEMVDEYCQSVGIATVELQVVEDNQEAQAFYRKIGFTRLNRIVMTRAVKTRAGRGRASRLVKGK
jgi:ribosomal protein S18 acetylase RimI-like enzyme